MAIPTVYAPVKRQDFTLKPFKVYKRYRLNSVDLVDTSSGYNIVDGVHTSLRTPIGSSKAANDPTNSFDGSYQHVVWQSYNHRYYKFPYNSLATFEHSNRRYTFKFLNYSCSVFSMPQHDFGERIKKYSVEVTNSSHGFNLQDDGNGNLYDTSIETGSFTKSYNLVGYWGFNNEFKRFKYRDGTQTTGYYQYESRVFEVDEKSSVQNIKYDVGVENSAMHAEFDGQSYIMTHDRNEFDPAKNEEFNISLWVKAPVTQSNVDGDYNILVSKRGVIRTQTFGIDPKYNQNDLIVNTRHVSQSILDNKTDIYPYEIQLMNSTAGTTDAGKIRIRRSNGINTSEIVSNTSITDGNYHHVSFNIGSENMSLYVDGTLQGSASSLNQDDILNRHSILFGALDRQFSYGFSGSLDEIRMYNTSLTSAQIATLADSSSMAMYQTAVVGNVFYRGGNIVVSSLMPNYQNVFKDTWNLNYRGTHTIYQNEVLCRVKKGSFNLTYNPTARQSFKSDLLINEMTGSLRPYATSIGLYNDQGDLVAIGKLAQPIQMRDDVDINFLIRFDL